MRLCIFVNLGAANLDIKLLAATQTMERTLAFTFIRLVLYLALSLALLIATLMGLGFGLIGGGAVDSISPHDSSSGIVGFLVCGVAIYYMRGFWFYLVKARHVALLVDAVAEKMIPEGSAQIDYARQRVVKRFASSRGLFSLHQLIKRIRIYLMKTCTPMGSQLPVISIPLVARFVGAVVAAPLNFLDEVVIAYSFKDDSTKGPWFAASEGVVFFAQNFHLIWRNAWIMFVLMYAGLFGVYLLMLVPVGWVEEIVPVPIGNWRYVFALVFAWSVKAALFEPIVLAGLISLCFKNSEGVQPNPEWVERLHNSSAEYNQIQNKANVEAADDTKAAVDVDGMDQKETG